MTAPRPRNHAPPCLPPCSLCRHHPAEVSLDRSVDYKLEVGKGGYEGEVRYLKPSLQNTKDGLSFGFGGKPIVVTLTKLPGADDAGRPAGGGPGNISIRGHRGHPLGLKG